MKNTSLRKAEDSLFNIPSQTLEQETTFQKVRSSVALFGLALSIGSAGILLNQQDKQAAAAPLPSDQPENTEIAEINPVVSPELGAPQPQVVPTPTTIIQPDRLSYELTPKPAPADQSEAAVEPKEASSPEFSDNQEQLLDQVVTRLKAGESISAVAEQYRSQKNLVKAPTTPTPELTKVESSSPKPSQTSDQAPKKPEKFIPVTTFSHGFSPTPPKLAPHAIEVSNPAQQVVSAKTKQVGQIVPISSRPNSLARQITKQPKYRSYRVVRGDTLEQISRRTGVSQVKLTRLNRLKNPNLLFAGQSIQIPVNGTNGTYVAQAQTKARKQIAIRPKPIVKSNGVAALPLVQKVTPVLQPAASSERQLIEQPAASKVAKLIPDQLVAPAGSSNLIEQFQDPPVAKLPETAIAASQLKHEIKLEPSKSDQVATPNNPATAVNPELRQPLAALPQPAPTPALEQVQIERPTLELPGSPATEISLPTPSSPQTRRARINQLLQSRPSRIAAAKIAPTSVLQLDQGNNLVQSPQLPDLSATAYLPDLADPSSGTIANSDFIWPARGTLTSGFGWRWGRVHQGIDIAGPVGTPIVAAASGVVNFAGWNSGGYGYMVDIRHSDGTVTRYAHNSAVYVRPGQTVNQGQPIAAMGSTGFSTGPHLHFEIRPNGGRAVNPIIYLARR